MAESWLTLDCFSALRPEAEITISQFEELSARAALEIERVTSWRASMACERVTLHRLAACQAAVMVQLMEDDKVSAATSGGALSSASNDGYSEAYASGANVADTQQKRITRLIRAHLSAPETRWMLYLGGVYHPPAR